MPSSTGNKLDFAGRTAIVTGGSQGIGFGVAERLLASGANVSVWAVNQDRLKQAAAKLDGGGRVQTVSVDIGNLASVGAATKAVLDAYGQIDVLINNAGVAGPNVKMWEFPPDTFAHMMHNQSTWRALFIAAARLSRKCSRATTGGSSISRR